MTLQQAMNELMLQGFIVSDGRNGTHVRHEPPHLSNIAVVFPEPPNRNRFWTALNNEAQQVRSDGFSLTCWHDVACHADNASYQQLVSLITHDRLAGIILASMPPDYLNSPLLTHPGIPRVAFMRGPTDHANLSNVEFSGESLARRAVERLRSDGKTRVAVITHPEASFEHWETLFNQNGLSLRPHWFHPIGRHASEGAQRLARLLFHKGQSERPDAVIITDDNCVEDITLGIAKSGLRATGDVEIIGHCNFPWPPPSALPIIRLGCNGHAMMEAALGLLNDMRLGKPPRTQIIEAVFETEITNNTNTPV